MNKNRRREIAGVIDRVSALADLISDLASDLESIRDEEQEYFDAMPESFQQSDRGTASEQAIENLSDALSTLEGFDVDEIVSQLETAAE